METTITISKEVRNKLVEMKYSLNCKDYNQVILKLIEREVKNGLGKEERKV